MDRKHKILLIIDGSVNILLGVVLLLFPAGLATLLGLLQTNTTFYPTILGSVIFGIGVALFVEVYGRRKNVHGLGLAGAISINLLVVVF